MRAICTKPPNLVVIMSDQHNAHVMRCSGDEVIQTPNLDALAQEGVHFTSAYCPHPLCVPSRRGFMTAQYPSDVNVWDNGSILSSDVPTFAHALRAAGYETVLCGRMHFAGPDQFHGFGRRLVGDCDGRVAPAIRGGGYNKTTGQTKYAVELPGHGKAGYEAFDEAVTQEARELLTNRRSADRPYCLVVGFILPHNPLICSRELFDYYLARLPEPQRPPDEYLSRLNIAIRKWRERRGVDDLAPEQNHRGLAAYYGLVTQLDRNIGQIIDAIKASPEAANTVIAYCTDHGDMACEQHGMWWKSCHFEGSARVPLIVSWPQSFACGQTVDAVVSLIDVGPTLLEIAGAEPLPYVSGRSLLSFLTEGRPPADWANETFCEYRGAHGDQPSCMIRSGPWKLMYYAEFDTFLLFNLDHDPDEQHDLAGSPAHQEVAKELLAKIHDRWSAARMLEGFDKEVCARRLVDRCGQALIPHEIQKPTPPPDANQFDFSQVPNWEELQERPTSAA